MTFFQVVNLVLLVALIAGALYLFLPRQRSGTAANSADERQFSGPIFRDDDRYWIGGVIYNNPEDPDWLVPKRYGLGRTLNWGHPTGRLIMVGLLLLAVALGIISAVVPGFSTYGCHPFTGCHLTP